MIESDFVSTTYQLATGKSGGLQVTSPKYERIRSLGNMFQQQWVREPGVDWNSLYRQRTSCGLITATNTFSMPANVFKLSRNEEDPVVIVDLNGVETNYSLVEPSKLYRYRYSNVCAKVRKNIVFPKPFSSDDSRIGGTLYVPAYVDAEPLNNPSSEIIVDDPMWLCYMCAAEYDRNEVDKQNQYSNLIALATNAMEGMKSNNGGQLTEIPMYQTVVGDTTI